MENFPKYFKGDNFELKALEPTFENAKILFNAIEKNKEQFKPFFVWVKFTNTVEDSLNYLKTTEIERENGDKFDFNIFVNNKLIGSIGIISSKKCNKSCELGYWLDKDFYGKGFISKSLKILEKEIFEKQNFNRITIKCIEPNISSANVALRNNYIKEACFRESFKSLIEDKFENEILFSKLKSEYN